MPLKQTQEFDARSLLQVGFHAMMRALCRPICAGGDVLGSCLCMSRRCLIALLPMCLLEPDHTQSLLALWLMEEAHLCHLQHYTQHDLRLRRFVPIIQDSHVYPVVLDAQRRVLSLPPIINGSHSAVCLQFSVPPYKLHSCFADFYGQGARVQVFFRRAFLAHGICTMDL